jgi:hypothetical protein
MSAQVSERRRRNLSWELEMDLSKRDIHIGADGSTIFLIKDDSYDNGVRWLSVFVVKPDPDWGRICFVNFEYGDGDTVIIDGRAHQSTRNCGMLIEGFSEDDMFLNSEDGIWPRRVSPEDVINAEWGPTVHAVLCLQRAYRVQRCNHFRAARTWRHARRTREWRQMVEDAVAIAQCHVGSSGQFVRKSKIETITPRRLLRAPLCVRH